MGFAEFLSGLFSSDPTREWPPHLPNPAALDLLQQTFNGHRFGANLEEFKSLGRATTAQRRKNGRVILSYAPSGLELQFGEAGFDSVRCYVARGPYSPDTPGLAFTTVRITHPGGQAAITAATTIAEIALWFGEPPVREEIDEEVVFEYEFGPLAMDVTLGAAKTVVDVGAWLK